MEEKLKVALTQCLKQFERENNVLIPYASMNEMSAFDEKGDVQWELDAVITPLH